MAYIENLITIQQQMIAHLLLFHLFSYTYQHKGLYLQNEKESNISLNSAIFFCEKILYVEMSFWDFIC